MYAQEPTRMSLPNARVVEEGPAPEAGESAAAQADELRRSGGPLRLPGPPRVDAADLIDLTTAAGRQAATSQPGAHHLHLRASDEDVWLWLGEPPDYALVEILLRGETYRLDGDTLLVDAAPLGPAANTLDAQAVLDASNTRANRPDDALGGTMDAIWATMNGGEGALNAADASQQTGPQAKPGAWYNAIRVEDGVPVVQRSPHDPRTTPLPALDLQGYRAMIVRDFDYSGAITAFEAAGGEAAFVAAVLERDPANAATLGPIARQIWAYATTGADLGGATDIAQLQGFLYALDPQIQLSFDSNTPLGEWFDAGTPEAPLPVRAGDGAHGRATILTMRHIIARLELPPQAKVPLQSPAPSFSDRDRFAHDSSPSMVYQKLPAVLDGVDQQLGRGAYDPTGQRASMTTRIDARFGGNDEHTMQLENAGPDPNLDKTRPSATRSTLADFSVLLEKAFVTLFPAQDAAGAEAFAGYFGLESVVKDLFDRERSGGAVTYTLKATALRERLGDVEPGRVQEDAAGESSIKAILMTLLYHPEYAEAALAKLAPVDRPRLNVVADESEQSLEYLALAQALAEHLGVEVRILAVPTPDRGFDARTDMAIVDLQSMRLTAGLGADPTQVGTLTFQATINGRPQVRTVPVTGKVEATLDAVQGDDRWRQAAAPLTDGQRVAGRQH